MTITSPFTISGSSPLPPSPHHPPDHSQIKGNKCFLFSSPSIVSQNELYKSIPQLLKITPPWTDRSTDATLDTRFTRENVQLSTLHLLQREQFTIERRKESQSGTSLLDFALWSRKLVPLSLTNPMQNQNQSRLGYPRIPAF